MKRDNREFIISQYERVKALGFVKSKRENNTGIGKTFEDYMGVVENNIEAPDLAGYEIKSHRDCSSSYTTLCTKAPDFPLKANAYLIREFGIPDEKKPELNNLHTSLFATKANTFHNKYSFRLINDRQRSIIKIGIYDFNSQKLLDESVGYNYATIQNILRKKLNNLFNVMAETRTVNGHEEFHFNHATIYTNPSFNKFLDLIDSGQIMYDIRIGSYKSGKNYGKPHDHGSGFRILEPNIYLLYDTKEIID